MHKIKLSPSYNMTILIGSIDWTDKIRDHVRPQFFDDEMVEWLFESVKGLFIVDNGYIYFQNDEDALAFKLQWT